MVSENSARIGFTGGTGYVLGGVWRVKSKGADFYFEPPLGIRDDYFHLSLHGPQSGFSTHRFHIKASDAAAERSGKRLFRSEFPARGVAFSGKQISRNAWLAVRMRWSWLLQRKKFAPIARQSIGSDFNENEKAFRLNAPLNENSYWDIDFVASYGAPYWKGEHAWSRESAKQRNARVIEFKNESGMWLTATSHHRSGLIFPTPSEVAPEAPWRGQEDAALFTGGAIDSDGVFWIVSTVTTTAIFGNDEERRRIWPDLYQERGGQL